MAKKKKKKKKHILPQKKNASSLKKNSISLEKKEKSKTIYPPYDFRTLFLLVVNGIGNGVFHLYTYHLCSQIFGDSFSTFFLFGSFLSIGMFLGICQNRFLPSSVSKIFALNFLFILLSLWTTSPLLHCYGRYSSSITLFSGFFWKGSILFVLLGFPAICFGSIFASFLKDTQEKKQSNFILFSWYAGSLLLGYLLVIFSFWKGLTFLQILFFLLLISQGVFLSKISCRPAFGIFILWLTSVVGNEMSPYFWQENLFKLNPKAFISNKHLQRALNLEAKKVYFEDLSAYEKLKIVDRAFKKNNLVQAEKVLSKVFKTNPYNPLIRYYIGTFYYRSKKYPLAREWYVKQIKYFPHRKRVESFYFLGKLFLDFKQYKTALTAFQRIQKTKKTYLDVQQLIQLCKKKISKTDHKKR